MRPRLVRHSPLRVGRVEVSHPEPGQYLAVHTLETIANKHHIRLQSHTRDGPHYRNANKTLPLQPTSRCAYKYCMCCPRLAYGNFTLLSQHKAEIRSAQARARVGSGRKTRSTSSGVARSKR